MRLDLIEPDARVLDDVVKKPGRHHLVVIALLGQELGDKQRVIDVGTPHAARALVGLEGERQRLLTDRVRLDKRGRGLNGRKLLPQYDLQAFDGPGAGAPGRKSYHFAGSSWGPQLFGRQPERCR